MSSTRTSKTTITITAIRCRRRRQDSRTRETRDAGGQGQATRRVAAPLTWEHRLADEVPARIPHDDNSVQEIQLEGTINADPAAPHRAGLLADAYRVLKPGAEVHVHGLAGDAPCARAAGDLALPGQRPPFSTCPRQPSSSTS